MKTRAASAALAVVLLAAVAATPAQPASPHSREDLLKYMQQTRQKFLRSIDGLSEAQWNYKPAPDRWSVAEVAEHITLTETFFNQTVREYMLKDPKAAQRPEGEVFTEAMILKMIPDRSQRANAPDNLRPQGTWASRADLVQAFEQARADSGDILAAQDDASLRSRYIKFPLGVLDAHQVLLFVAAHTARHTKQIEEVKKDKGFPKS